MSFAAAIDGSGISTMSDATCDSSNGSVCWAELFPSEFLRRQRAFNVVYLPMGLCEPHGQIAALGLDSIKAQLLCEETARAVGGIVAPCTGFHVHECGPSARWLLENVGEADAPLGSVGPWAMVHFLLHQLRSLANSGFAAAVIVSGHAGAHAADLNMIAERFAAAFDFPCRYVTDAELAKPRFQPDHAGQYEISLLQFLRPELVDWNRASLASEKAGGGKLALGSDAAKAKAATGKVIFGHLVERLSEVAQGILSASEAPRRHVSFLETEELWTHLRGNAASWACVKPRPGQAEVPADSRWKEGERVAHI